MKIIKLEAENVKRLHAVSITPKGDIVEISGNNTNGKTSVLDAIYWALAGTGTVQAEPIRRGAEKATIKLDMGELIVTRTFKRQEGEKYTTSLKVENAEGASYKSPQSMLDALLSGLTFDPLEFSRMKAKEQFDMLRAFVPDIDFQKIDDLNRGDFERRTTENRRLEEAKAAAGLIAVRTDLPEETTNEATLLDEIASAAQRNQDLINEQNRRRLALEALQKLLSDAAKCRTEAAQLRQRAAELDEQADSFDARHRAGLGEHQQLAPLGQPVEVADLRARLTQVQSLNEAIRKNSEALRRKHALEKVAAEAAMLSDELTAKIKARNKAKNDAIAAAKMPVEGLGFGEGYVTFNGVPFNQASDAEQLRASIAIAMHTNSKLRVIRVRDGSLLDDQSFALLTELAAANGCQVWVETVRSVTDSAVIIEDGSVRGAARGEQLTAGAA